MTKLSSSGLTRGSIHMHSEMDPQIKPEDDKSKNDIIFSAPGKLILSGEYALVEGYPGLVAAVSRRVFCTRHESSKTYVSGMGIGPFEVTIGKGKRAEIPDDVNNSFSVVKSVFEEALNIGYTLDNGHYFFDSNQLHITSSDKLGLGSSAAIAVSLSAHLVPRDGKKLNADKIFSLAFNANNRLSNGLGSGIDIAASVYGGILEYIKTSQPKIIHHDRCNALKDLYCIYVGKPQKTQNFIDSINEYKNLHCATYQDLMEKLGRAAEALTASFLQVSFPRRPESTVSPRVLDPRLQGDDEGNKHNESSNFCDKVKNINNYFNLLEILGDKANVNIISKEHKQIHEIAKNHGGTAKPSGAGGGDIATCLIPPSHTVDFKKALVHEGFSLVELDIAQGINLEKNGRSDRI